MPALHKRDARLYYCAPKPPVQISPGTWKQAGQSKRRLQFSNILAIAPVWHARNRNHQCHLVSCYRAVERVLWKGQSSCLDNQTNGNTVCYRSLAYVNRDNDRRNRNAMVPDTAGMGQRVVPLAVTTPAGE